MVYLRLLYLGLFCAEPTELFFQTWDVRISQLAGWPCLGCFVDEPDPHHHPALYVNNRSFARLYAKSVIFSRLADFPPPAHREKA